MNNNSSVQTLQTNVTVQNMRGLHMKFAGELTAISNKFKSAISISKNSRVADGKNILDLVSLSAAPGASLNVTVNGEDADEALSAVTEFFKNYTGDR